jgi:hypothetical protein
MTKSLAAATYVNGSLAASLAPPNIDSSFWMIQPKISMTPAILTARRLLMTTDLALVVTTSRKYQAVLSHLGFFGGHPRSVVG